MDLQTVTQWYNFTGRTVVITGGAGILGGEMACILVGCGANVAILDRDPSLADRLMDHLGCGPGCSVVVYANVLEFETFKIRVHAIAPGFFLTAQNRFLLTDEATGELTPRGKTIIDHTPMRRFGDPENLLGTVLWLLSPAAAFVHGVVVPVDGGFSAFSGV